MIFWVTFAAAIGSGLIAGAFFIFSAAVMPALRRLPAGEGMAAMQSINVVIMNSVFLGVFMGTALLSVILAVAAFLDWVPGVSVYLVAGVIFYVVGTFLLTIVFNVPLNNALDAGDASTAAGQEVWKNYLTNWTFWNHIRTVASLLATAMFVFALAQTPH